jgi:hypothetical protein
MEPDNPKAWADDVDSHDQELAETQLIQELEKNGLVYRPESGLHSSFVTGNCRGMNLDKVVNKTAMLKYLHEYTNYEQILTKMHQENHNRLTRPQLIGCAKAEAIKLHPVPKKWPWLQPSASQMADKDGFVTVSKASKTRK